MGLLGAELRTSGGGLDAGDVHEAAQECAGSAERTEEGADFVSVRKK
jgi:hypothetical protein